MKSRVSGCSGARPWKMRLRSSEVSAYESLHEIDAAMLNKSASLVVCPVDDGAISLRVKHIIVLRGVARSGKD